MAFENSDRLSPPATTHEVVKQTGQPVPGGHRTIWNMAVNGRIPAEQENGRWYIRRADLPAVIAALGLAQQPATAQAA